MDDAELERLRAEQPAHTYCQPCRKGDCENCLYLIRPASCACDCTWLREGRPPRPRRPA